MFPQKHIVTNIKTKQSISGTLLTQTIPACWLLSLYQYSPTMIYLLVYPPFFICPPSQHEMYCCLAYLCKLICLAMGWYHSPPTNNSAIAGVLYSTPAYCCVYPHPNGNGMMAMAARQMVSAAQRKSSWGWLLCLSNSPTIIPYIRRCMIDDGSRDIINIVLLMMVVVVLLLCVSVCINVKWERRNIRRWYQQQHNNKQMYLPREQGNSGNGIVVLLIMRRWRWWQ